MINKHNKYSLDCACIRACSLVSLLTRTVVCFCKSQPLHANDEPCVYRPFSQLSFQPMFLFSFRDKYRFYACLLRARFDENKQEKDMVKATMMLKAGEEEFWANQHPQPYLFPDSPGGTSYERYECYKVGDLVRCVLCCVFAEDYVLI